MRQTAIGILRISLPLRRPTTRPTALVTRPGLRRHLGTRHAFRGVTAYILVVLSLERLAVR